MRIPQGTERLSNGFLSIQIEQARRRSNAFPTRSRKLEEEVKEVSEEFERDPFGGDALLVETWDVIYTAEGILRKFDKDQVQQARTVVVEKAKRRGDI